MALVIQLLVALALLAVLFFVVRRVAGFLLSVVAVVLAVCIVVFLLERFAPAFADELSYHIRELLRMVGLVSA